MNNGEYLDIKPVEGLVHSIGVEKVFGAPVKEGDVTLIPVAQVMFGFGYGSGSEGRDKGDALSGETMDDMDEAGADKTSGDAGGGGAGAGGRATPRGFIRIEDGRASYSAIDDERWIPLAGILMVAWVVFWVMATVRFIARQVAQTKQAQRDA